LQLDIRKPKTEYFYLYLLLFTILLGGFLRFYHIGNQPLWIDEAMSYWFSTRSMHELWTVVPRIETNPPLYYTILKIWMSLFGSSEASLRSLSAIMSVGCIPLVFMVGKLMGKSIGGSWIGAIAAIMFAVSPVQIQYAQEARPYAMLTFATTLALCAVLWIMRHPVEACEPVFRKRFHLRQSNADASGRPAYSAWLVTILAMAFALWLHNTSLFYIFALFLIILVWFIGELRFNRNFFVNIVIVFTTALLLWAPYIKFLVEQTKHSPLWVQELTAKNIVDVLVWLVLGNNLSWTPSIGEALKISVFFVLVVLAITGLLNIRKRSGLYVSILVLGAILGPILIELVLSLVLRPIFVGRTLIYTNVPFYIAAAAGIMTLRTSPKRVFVAASISVFLLKLSFGYFINYQKEPWDKVEHVISQQAAKNDIVLLVPSGVETVFTYYQMRRGNNISCRVIPFPSSPYSAVEQRDGSRPRFLDPYVSHSDVPAIKNLIADKTGVWLVLMDEIFDPHKLMFKVITHNRSLVAKWHFQRIQVFKFN
jgi:uncharacterized membrane protein